jgi:pimeloyl-ACP methyl ester carboxylesterase
VSVEKECPRVELKWVKNAGHFCNLDQPEQVAAAINEFLRQS